MPVPVPKHAAQAGGSNMAVRFQVADMEEMVIWEQYTVTLSKDSRRGFGIAISGGRDRPSGSDGDTSIVISDIVPGGPADGRLLTRDKIAMVNGLSMENVSSSFAIHTLKSCGKVANITVKRPRRIHLPVTTQPKSLLPSGSVPRSANATHYDSDEDYSRQADTSSPPGASRRSSDGLRLAEADHNRGYEGDSSSERSSGRYCDEEDAPRRQPVRSRRRSQDGSHRRRSQDSDSDRQPFTNGYGHQGSASGLALVSGFKRLPRQDVPMKPVRSTLVKSKESEEYGLKLGSQIFIRHITDTGLAAKDTSLQEGDLILKINGVASENMSLEETRRLIEKSEGRLTLIVLRDNSQFLVNIPQVRDNDSDSSQLDDISELGSDTSMPSPVESPRQPPDSKQRNTFLSRKHSSREEVVVPVEQMSVSPVVDAEETPVDDSHGGWDTPPSQGGVDGHSPGFKTVSFVKAKNIGLRLAGGNDVGIFVTGVQEGSPAEIQGITEGNQILQVNDRVFRNLTREEAVQYLLELMPGEEVTFYMQDKQDVYRGTIKSSLGDSFYIRTHFDFEKDAPSGLSFTRGEVFHILDTMYRGKMGSWLAVRMGKELQELDKGIIPNKSRAEQIASLESVLKATSSSSGARAEFWKLRGLRGAKKNMRKSREDLSALTKQGHYPPYEKVVLKEATFKRPVVVLGPIADIAMQKLSTEMPDQFEIAESITREEGSAKVIKLDAVWQIAEQEKHALLDITPAAVERLNYLQYFPIVVFCDPDNRQGVKAMRQWLVPDSKKSSRRLYAQALKMRKHWSHLFTATISLAGSSNSWYHSLKDIIRVQQARPVWMTEEQVDPSTEEALEIPSQPPAGSSGYLTCDSRANSDYEETDAEGEAYTDQELDEPYQEEALARSSEPAEQSGELDFSERVAAALAYPIDRHDGDQQPQGQWRQDYTIREYEHDALRKKFTQAQAYDSESDQDYGYDWGPATDL